jgi:hypothetical protein
LELLPAKSESTKNEIGAFLNFSQKLKSVDVFVGAAANAGATVGGEEGGTGFVVLNSFVIPAGRGSATGTGATEVAWAKALVETEKTSKKVINNFIFSPIKMNFPLFIKPA